MKKGWVVPLHDHISEQITFVQKGVLKFKIDSKEIVVSEGEILCIPQYASRGGSVGRHRDFRRFQPSPQRLGCWYG